MKNERYFSDLPELSQAQMVIKALLEKFGFTPKQFGDAIGIGKSTTIYDIVNGKTARISKSMAIKIKNAFPDINESFLLTGRGEPFEKQEPIPIKDDISSVVLHLVAMVQQQSNKIDALIEKINELEAQLNKVKSKK